MCPTLKRFCPESWKASLQCARLGFPHAGRCLSSGKASLPCAGLSLPCAGRSFPCAGLGFPHAGRCLSSGKAGLPCARLSFPHAGFDLKPKKGDGLYDKSNKLYKEQIQISFKTKK